MDAIRLYSAQVPGQIKKIVSTLVQGSQEDVKDFLPIELGKIERNSAECLRLAKSVEAKFEHVMDLTGELLEVSTAAREYYQKSQEELQLKRDIALAKEKAAREKLKSAEEQQKKLQADVREAKRSWEKAVDSMPSGWDVLGMEVVETIVHACFGGPGNAAPGADRGRETGDEQSPIQDKPVVEDKAAEQLKLYTTQLSEDLTSASERVKGDTGPKEEEPLAKKLQKMKILMESFQADLADKDHPEVRELLKQGFEISREGEEMASQLSFTPNKLMEISKQAADLNDKVIKFCTNRRAQREANPYTTKPPGADRGRETGEEQSPIQDKPVVEDKGAAEQLKLYTTQLSEDLTSASERVKGDTGPKEEEPLAKKLQKMKILMESFQEDLAGKDHAEVQELLKQGFEISREGEEMASQLSFTPSKLMAIAKQAANLKDKVIKLCTKRRAQREANPYTTKPPRQAKSMVSSANSGRTSAAKAAVEGARVKMAETKSTLERQENRYDKTCEQLKERNEELAKVLESLAELSPEKLADFDQIRITLMRGIKALASVREQWQKLVEFFQYITNIIKVCQNESLSSFVEYAKVGQKRALENGYFFFFFFFFFFLFPFYFIIIFNLF